MNLGVFIVGILLCIFSWLLDVPIVGTVGLVVVVIAALWFLLDVDGLVRDWRWW